MTDLLFAVGARVVYVDPVTRRVTAECGYVTGWDANFVHVRYDGQKCPTLTHPDNLRTVGRPG